MEGSLVPVRERLGWAKKRFKELEAECDSFVYHEPDKPSPGLLEEFNGPEGWVSLRATVPDVMPNSVAWLVGEVLYHLRASLDNLAWQLVLANGGTPGKHTEFPVFKDKGAFKAGARSRTRGMSTTAKATIERLQPFAEWPEHPEHTTLWKIHDLNNIDKHRLPYLICLWLAWVKWNAVVGANGRLVTQRKRGCLENDAEILRLEWDPSATPDDQKMEMNYSVSLDVAIHNPGQVEFMSGRNEPEGSVPVRHIFQVGLDYIEGTVLPAFEAEFRP